MTKVPVNIQDAFLNQIRKDNVPIIVYLVNGFQIRGLLKAFDNYTIVVESSEGKGEVKQQLVFKHAISTFTPLRPVNFLAE